MSNRKDWYPANPGIQRVGYSGFLSAVWMLWRMNRSARKVKVTVRAEITLPVRWLA